MPKNIKSTNKKKQKKKDKKTAEYLISKLRKLKLNSIDSKGYIIQEVTNNEWIFCFFSRSMNMNLPYFIKANSLEELLTVNIIFIMVTRHCQPHALDNLLTDYVHILRPVINDSPIFPQWIEISKTVSTEETTYQQWFNICALTPLMQACFFSDKVKITQKSDLAEVLIKHKCDINYLSSLSSITDSKKKLMLTPRGEASGLYIHREKIITNSAYKKVVTRGDKKYQENVLDISADGETIIDEEKQIKVNFRDECILDIIKRNKTLAQNLPFSSLIVEQENEKKELLESFFNDAAFSIPKANFITLSERIFKTIYNPATKIVVIEFFLPIITIIGQSSDSCSGISYINFSVSIDEIKSIVFSGSEINGIDLELFLAFGPEVFSLIDKRSAFDLAISAGNSAAIELLVNKGVNPWPVEDYRGLKKNEHTFLKLLCKKHYNCIDWYIKNLPYLGEEMFNICVEFGFYPYARKILLSTKNEINFDSICKNNFSEALKIIFADPPNLGESVFDSGNDDGTSFKILKLVYKGKICKFDPKYLVRIYELCPDFVYAFFSCQYDRMGLSKERFLIIINYLILIRHETLLEYLLCDLNNEHIVLKLDEKRKIILNQISANSIKIQSLISNFLPKLKTANEKVATKPKSLDLHCSNNSHKKSAQFNLGEYVEKIKKYIVELVSIEAQAHDKKIEAVTLLKLLELENNTGSEISANNIISFFETITKPTKVKNYVYWNDIIKFCIQSFKLENELVIINKKINDCLDELESHQKKEIKKEEGQEKVSNAFDPIVNKIDKLQKKISSLVNKISKNNLDTEKVLITDKFSDKKDLAQQDTKPSCEDRFTEKTTIESANSKANLQDKKKYKQEILGSERDSCTSIKKKEPKKESVIKYEIIFSDEHLKIILQKIIQEFFHQEFIIDIGENYFYMCIRFSVLLQEINKKYNLSSLGKLCFPDRKTDFIRNFLVHWGYFLTKVQDPKLKDEYFIVIDSLFRIKNVSFQVSLSLADIKYSIQQFIDNVYAVSIKIIGFTRSNLALTSSIKEFAYNFFVNLEHIPKRKARISEIITLLYEKIDNYLSFNSYLDKGLEKDLEEIYIIKLLIIEFQEHCKFLNIEDRYQINKLYNLTSLNLRNIFSHHAAELPEEYELLEDRKKEDFFQNIEIRFVLPAHILNTSFLSELISQIELYKSLQKTRIMKKKGESSDVKGKLKVKPESLHSQSLNSLTFSKELDLANNSVFKDLSTNKAAEDVVGDYSLDSEHLETTQKNHL